MTVRYTDSARIDLETAFEWYQGQRIGLSFEFLDCLEATISTIQQIKFRKFRANKGTAGVDGVSFEAIEEQDGVAAFIAELEDRHQLDGRRRMLCGEEHRKAVCGKTARTV